MSERIVFGVPRVPTGLLSRRSLLARIGSAPLTVIRGASGSGKTVLMSQWVLASDVPGVWVTVEPDIGDRMAFWSAVCEAASQAGIELRMPVIETGPGEEDALRSALVRAFRGRVEPFVILIDDAHELRDPLVHEDLLKIVRSCPSILAIVGTRAHSELEAPRQSLTLDIARVGPDDLSFSVEDIEQLVDARDAGHRSDPAHGTAAQLFDASGGNPLILRAILTGASSGTASHHTPAMIVGDLLTEVFSRLGEGLEAFALSTAVPDDLDTALAERLSGLERGRVEAMLVLLESEGLLMRREASDGPRFRYHPMAREVLRDELRRAQLKQYRQLSLLASAAAETDRHFIAALRHAVDAEDYPRASDVCLHGGLSLLRSRGAAAVLQRVPLRYVARLPFIAIVLALAANARSERWKAIELMTLALAASRASRGRQRVAERVGLALIESTVLRITGRASESARSARRMASLLDEAPSEELEEIADQIDAFRAQGALSLFRAGLLSEAGIAAERVGASAYALQQGRTEALSAASLIAAVEAIHGECAAAAGTLDRIQVSEFPEEQRDGYVGSLAHLATGIVALERADLDEAARAAEFVRERPNLEHGMLFTVLGALVWLWNGQPRTGLRLLAERERSDRPRARVSKQDSRALAMCRVLLHAALGELGAANVALREIDRDDPMAVVLEGQLLLLERRPDLVVERLGRVGELPGPRLQGAADLLVACASLLVGDEGVADAAMRRFLAAATLHGVLSPFVLIPESHRAALLALAERIGAEPQTLALFRGLPAPFQATGTRVVLTRREADVLDGIRRNASQAEIAASMGVAANTVKAQTRTLYRKLGASRRDDALRAAYLQGLLEGPVVPRERPLRRR